MVCTHLDVNIANEVIPQIVANVHLFDLPIFVLALDKNVLEKIVVMLLHLLIGDVGHH